MGFRMKRTLFPIFVFLTSILFGDSLTAGIEVYFSPKGKCEHRIVELIENSKDRIDAAVYSVNNSRIVEALKRATKRGVAVRLLVDRVQAAGRGNRDTTINLKRSGIDIRIHSKNRIQHNKFAIFDKKQVVTGSFNWTEPAQIHNEENCVILDDKSSVEAFYSRFNQYLWRVNTKEKSDQSFARLRKKLNRVPANQKR